ERTRGDDRWPMSAKFCRGILQNPIVSGIQSLESPYRGRIATSEPSRLDQRMPRVRWKRGGPLTAQPPRPQNWRRSGWVGDEKPSHRGFRHQSSQEAGTGHVHLAAYRIGPGLLVEGEHHVVSIADRRGRGSWLRGTAGVGGYSHGALIRSAPALF